MSQRWISVLSGLLACTGPSAVDPKAPPVDTAEHVSAAPDADGDGYDDATDCADDDASIHPGAEEVCDGIDTDCDGLTDDDEDDISMHPDEDGDGYGSTRESWAGCGGPEGWVEPGGDCEDDDPEVNPGADETCDERDNDCDGAVDDDPVDIRSWYVDEDGDGWGVGEAMATACSAPGEGYAAQVGDCDDTSGAVSPSEREVCDGVDNDCDGEVDVDPEDRDTLYQDLDLDGYGASDSASRTCEARGGDWIAVGGDCDDADASVFPGATDAWYDGYDTDCAGDSDFDADGDGYVVSSLADEDTPTRTPGSGEVVDDGSTTLGGDCDDSDGSFHPGAEERCSEGVDYNCDGSTGETDLDADGWPACQDCDDGQPEVNPDGVELCDDANGQDDDCDGWTDPVCGTGGALLYDWSSYEGDTWGTTYLWDGVATARAEIHEDCALGWTVSYDGATDTDYLSSHFEVHVCVDTSTWTVWGLDDGTWTPDTVAIYSKNADTYTFDPETGGLTFLARWDCSGDPDCGSAGLSWGGTLHGTVFLDL